jgi:acyl carrier protein
MTKEEVYAKLCQILTEYLRLDSSEITPVSHITLDLGADSLALVELGFMFKETFDIPMIAPDEELMIVGNLAEHIYALRQVEQPV